MATTDPVPSKHPADLLFNAEKLDQVVNSPELTFTDRLGHTKDTAAGALYKIAGITNRGAWATATVYAPKDIVLQGGTWYVAVLPHTSSASFATDEATKWRVYQGVTTGDLGASSGSSLVGFIHYLTGAVARSLEDQARDTVSVFNFMTLAQRSDVRARTKLLDHSSAIQAAANSGAKKIIFPQGRYRSDSGLTVPDWQHWVGEGYHPTIAPTNAAVTIEFSQSSGVALTCGYTPTFENIYFINTAGTFNDTTDVLSGTTAACIALTDNLEMERCSFAFWRKGVRLGASTYYLKTSRVEFNRCTAGYSVNGAAPYNVHIDSPISRKTAIFFEGEAANPARNIKIFGGSIEGYSSIAENFLDLSAFGTYFETTAPHDGCFGISPNVNGASVAIFGAEVYLNYMARFINMSGLTNVMLTGSGNVYDGVGKAGGIIHYLPDTGTVSLPGDRFGAGHPNDCLYVDSIAKAAKFNITMPLLPAGNVQAAYSTLQIVGPRGFWMNALAAEPATKVAGMTVLADCSTWDPLTRAYGRPYWVTWQGDRWAEAGGILVATALPDSTAATVADLKADFNTLLAKLRTAKVMAS